ncbi:MAG: hypothetical protein MI866_03925, partial [Bacteroidales bacterium]|nr:hypothetical protein [Bacteroidales bacterium]
IQRVNKMDYGIKSFLPLTACSAALFLLIEVFFPWEEAFKDSFWISLILLTLLSLIIFVFLSKGPRLWFEHKWSFHKKFYAYALSMILTFVVVPLFILYITVYHQESTLYYMHQQRAVADKYIERKNAFTNTTDDALNLLNDKGHHFRSFHKMEILKDTSKVSCIKWDMPVTKNFVKIFGQAKTNMFFINNLIEDRGNRNKATYFNSEDANATYHYGHTDSSLILRVKKGGIPHNNKLIYVTIDKPKLTNIWKRYLGFVYGITIIVILFYIYFPKISHFLFPHIKYNQQLFPLSQSTRLIPFPKTGDRRYIVTLPDKVFYDKCLANNNSVLYRLHQPAGWKSFINDRKSFNHRYLFIDHMSFTSVDNLTAFVNRLEEMLDCDKKCSVNIVCFRIPKVLVQHIRDTLIDNCTTPDNLLKLESALRRLVNALAYFSMSYVPINQQPIADKFKIQSYPENQEWLEEELSGNAMLESKVTIFEERKDTIGRNELEKHVNEDNIYQGYLINRTYYQKIWDSCNDEEKSILFDIAADYVINLHKNGFVNILLNKGLILYKPYLDIFNHGFRLFVKRQDVEVNSINEKLKATNKNGWSNYSLPIKLLGVAIVVFLIITQQEFLTGIQSIIISIGAILSFAIRFFNFSGKGGNISS